MDLITVSGPPSSGKTSVLIKTIENFLKRNIKVGVVKFDCLFTDDDIYFEKLGIPVKKGLSGSLCPDHYFVSNIEEVVEWGLKENVDILITESAGLCNRCSPYIKDIKAVLLREPLRANVRDIPLYRRKINKRDNPELFLLDEFTRLGQISLQIKVEDILKLYDMSSSELEIKLNKWDLLALMRCCWGLSPLENKR